MWKEECEPQLTHVIMLAELANPISQQHGSQGPRSDPCWVSPCDGHEVCCFQTDFVSRGHKLAKRERPSSGYAVGTVRMRTPPREEGAQNQSRGENQQPWV